MEEDQWRTVAGSVKGRFMLPASHARDHHGEMARPVARVHKHGTSPSGTGTRQQTSAVGDPSAAKRMRTEPRGAARESWMDRSTEHMKHTMQVGR